ncbi:hypothetical protein BDB01DRAFT_573460 [Pilobolus umbonatus]|nr:hypothetical protein BDB01DRAFT_573460 [Pilobolus umbonatus]
MNIDHEITIEDIDIDKKICIMLKVDQQYLKKRSIWNKLLNKKQQELDRYVHSQSGAICQTVVASSRLIKSSHEVSAVTGTMVLVNDWYTPHHRHKQSMRKKAVGKIIIQSLYIPRCCSLHSYPQSMKEAIDGTEIRRFYKTTWISGYMQQIGGNTKVPCIRYFRLEGRFITAAIGMQHEVLYKIPLSRVTQLICDKSRILKKEGNSISHRYTLQQLDTLAESHANYPAQNDSTSNYDFKFQLNCDNDDSITFSCESIEERKKWIHFLEVMINYQPDIPDWLHLYDQ